VPSSLTIHRWTTAGLGSVNTYWLETDASVIVIDGQRELSKARKVLTEIDATGKPIAAVFLTHPHPDHFGGLGVFAPMNAGVPIYGSQQTRASIAEDRYGLVKASKETVDDFPSEISLPHNDLVEGQKIVIDGVHLVAHELGEGEAECMTVLHVPEEHALFCADVIQDRMTAFLVEGRLSSWIQQIAKLDSLFPDVKLYYPGHGEPGSAKELAERQAEYLSTFRNVVDVATRGEEVTPAEEQRVIDEMETRYPGYHPVAAIPDLLRRNIAPVAKELHRRYAAEGAR